MLNFLRVIVFIHFSLLSIHLFSQFTDDFSDGNITLNPEWIGDTSDFYINENSELQLNAPAQNGISYISVESRSLLNSSWEFFVRLEFNPSSSNYCDIYLISDNSTIPETNNGYFIRLGGNDDVCLYKSANFTNQKLIDGRDGILNSSDVKIKVKVIRDLIGNWELLTDTSGRNEYISEGICLDNTITSGFCFGIVCHYTSTRSDKFYFDNFIVSGDPGIDTISPEITGYSVISENEIELQFSENVNTPEISDTNNYLLAEQLSHPCSIEIMQGSPTILKIKFAKTFTNDKNYILNIENIYDLDRNKMRTKEIQFSVHTPKLYDLVINEIMADPLPSIGLPDFEYIEIYNRTAFSMNLENWNIRTGNSEKSLPKIELEPSKYCLICTAGSEPEYAQYGKVAGILTSNSLLNSGTSIVLSDENGQIIDSVNYKISWYQDIAKSDGGWSLERIDPANTCGHESNWTVSENSSGGTPGRLNSVYRLNMDESKPEVNELFVSNNHCLTIKFTEAINQITALNSENYYVNNAIGYPDSIYQSGLKIILYFKNNFENSTSYRLMIKKISDECGNMIENTSIDFTYNTIRPFDIVLNEIFVDPTPVVVLPEYEFIELYNTTSFKLYFSGWKLNVNGKEYLLPDFSMIPDEYLILTSEEASQSYTMYGNVLSITSFPALNNDGATISLLNDSGEVMSFVEYNSKWYNDDLKSQGGWTLERIDPGNRCGQQDNWTASIAKEGGTPGKINSVFRSNSDNDVPVLKRAYPADKQSVILYFNEPMNFTQVLNRFTFQVNKSFGYPQKAEFIGIQYDKILLTFNKPFLKGMIYTLTIEKPLCDCNNNQIFANSAVQFAIPDSAVQNDVIINEILFNPLPGGVDFLELYNRSNKVIDLQKLFLASIDDQTKKINRQFQIISEGYLFFPSEYNVMTTDPDNIRQNYTIKNTEVFIQMDNFPSFPDDKGRVVLTDKWINTIDDFEYNENMHLPILSTNEGVSLERLNPELPANNKNNWHSAAETAGFATPGYKNSQYIDFLAKEDQFILNPEVFSPDNDGIDDFLSINYKFDEEGNICTVLIFNSWGRQVKELINHEVLGTEGSFSWDGTDDSGRIAGIGHYIIYLQTYNLKGEVTELKKTCVLAKKLK